MRRFFWFLVAILLIVAGILLFESEQASPQGQHSFKINTVTMWAGEDPVDQAVRQYEERIINEYLAAFAAEEARRQADLQTAMASAVPHPVATAAPTGDCSNIPAWFPAGIAWRESHCSYDAYNPGGCGGNGCIGAFQFDARHFFGWGNGQAACGDLDPWTIDGQNECAWRLSREGTQFGAWGG
jgi:hypothetical protein